LHYLFGHRTGLQKLPKKFGPLVEKLIGLEGKRGLIGYLTLRLGRSLNKLKNFIATKIGQGIILGPGRRVV